MFRGAQTVEQLLESVRAPLGSTGGLATIPGLLVGITLDGNVFWSANAQVLAVL